MDSRSRSGMTKEKMIYLIALFLIFYFALAWRKLDWAVLLLIFALPSYLIRFRVAGVPMTLLEAMILIAFFVWFVKETNFINFLRGKYRVKEYFENRKKRMPYPFGWEISLWILVAWVATVFAGFNNEALGIWKAYFFEPALLFVLVLNVFRENTTSNEDNLLEINKINNKVNPPTPFAKGGLILWALAGSAFVVSCLAIYQKITGNLIDNPMWAAEETRRSVSFFGYPNAVGLYLGPVVVILAGWFIDNIGRFRKLRYYNQDTITKKPPNSNVQTQDNKMPIVKICKFGVCDLKFFWLLFLGYWLFIPLTIFFSLLSIYFAKSEGALIGIVAALFVFGILAGKKLRWITIIGSVIIVGGLMAYQPTRYYVEDKVQLHDFSGQVRRQQWIETWRMMTASPQRFIFGTGLSNYQTSIKPYHQEGIFVRDYRDPNWRRMVVFNDEFKKKVWQPVEIYMYPHNILLNFWTELGILGVLLFIWIIGKFFYFGFWILNFGLRENIGKIQIPKSKIQNLKYLNIGLICSMVVIIVHGLVDVPYFKNDLAVMFWTFVAMLSLINLELKNTIKK